MRFWSSLCVSLNPCWVVPSRFSVFLVTLIDMLVAGATILLSIPPILERQAGLNLLAGKGRSRYVLYWGVASIPLFAFVGLYSAFVQLCAICGKKNETPRAGRFALFMLLETVGFVAPFYLIQDYDTAINELTDKNPDFLSFKLLQLNPVTVCLFLYEIFSFWVVYRYNLIVREEAKRKQRKKPKAVVRQLEVTQDVQIKKGEKEHVCIEMTGSVAPQPKASNRYPNLQSLEEELQKLPTYREGKKFREAKPSAETKCVGAKDTGNQEKGSKATKSQKRVLTEFERRKQRYATRGVLFEDFEFPANESSIGNCLGRKIQWKRPHEISPNAKFTADGFTRFDVLQGELGDCWFLAALGNLTLHPALFQEVVPADNEWTYKGTTYAGICHFWFFFEDEWVEVTIDDRLPTRKGKLVFLHSSDPNEFWPSLVEKAYAKLHGSYAAIEGSEGIGRAMTNLTGANVSRYYLKKSSKLLQLFAKIEEALNEGAIVGICCNTGDESVGIVGDHAYSVTAAARIVVRGKEEMCIRIRNPWGDEIEWSGEFSDRDPVWKCVSKDAKFALQQRAAEDGEFWFPFKVSNNYFSFVEICLV